MNEYKKAVKILSEVEGFNTEFAGISKGEVREVREFLSHSFWDIKEIDDGEAMRDEWDVPASLIPFYGDWHDLFCLDCKDGKIHEINDSREITFSWSTFADFKKSLILVADWEEEPSSGDDGIVSSWFNFKRKN